MKKFPFFIAVFFFAYSFANAQTAVLYNSTQLFSVDAGAIVYVAGHIVNDTNGLIHNEGDIYLTGNWTNNEPFGYFNPTTGTVILDGFAQIIQGTQTTTFNNLDCRNTGTKILNINTTVGGTAGVLSLNDAAFELNSNRLIVTNPLPAAIQRNNGYIISETDFSTGSYGTIQWNLGNSASNYEFPFGTTPPAGTYIPFLFNVTTSGTGTNGNISVATYPTIVTNSPNNSLLPNTVGNLNDANGNNAYATCLDRFWITDANNYSNPPIAAVSFYYTDAEWDNSGGSTNNIVEDSLKAWRWNGSQWQFPVMSTNNSSSNNVTVTSVNDFSIWTLKGAEVAPCGDFFLPNAFSPNGDTKNDMFPWKTPRSCITDFSIKIYNRWGNLVFESAEQNKVWDGSTPKGKDGNEGVYAYELQATLNDGTPIGKKGTVTLMK